MSKSIKGNAPKNAASGAAFGIDKNVDEMTEAELKKYLEFYMRLFTYIPADVQDFISQIGQHCGITTRDYQTHYGMYLGCTVEITEHRIRSVERVFDQVRRKYFIEESMQTIKTNNMTGFRFVQSQEEIPEGA